jgi:hypothetical protein
MEEHSVYDFTISSRPQSFIASLFLVLSAHFQLFLPVRLIEYFTMKVVMTSCKFTAETKNLCNCEAEKLKRLNYIPDREKNGESLMYVRIS